MPKEIETQGNETESFYDISKNGAQKKQRAQSSTSRKEYVTLGYSDHESKGINNNDQNNENQDL